MTAEGQKMKGLTMTGCCVRALLAKAKTQTRRVITPQPPASCHMEPFGQTNTGECIWVAVSNDSRCGMPNVWKPPYQPGDIVYIKEALYCEKDVFYPSIRYEADGRAVELRDLRRLWRWKRPCLSSRYMPREAARIFRRVKSVRAERLQDITYEDIWAEGTGIPNSEMRNELGEERTRMCAYEQFARVWDDLNAKRGYPWESNPWVWVYGLEEVGA